MLTDITVSGCLRDLAVKYSSDKLHYHSYIPFYEKLFSGRRDAQRVLEIGIGYKDLMVSFLPAGVEYVHGSSLRMWADYFPNALVCGADIREDALVNEGRIVSEQCDQSSPMTLLGLVQMFGAPFDLIIDDGSHQFEHQFITAATLLPYLTLGGLYVIEDVWEAEGVWLADAFGGQLLRGEKGRDDNMVVVTRIPHGSRRQQ